jgi:hypothetical protein
VCVADSTPQVDDLLPAVIRAAGAAQLPASNEVLLERVADDLEAATGAALYDVMRS